MHRPCRIHFTKYRRRANYHAYICNNRFNADIVYTSFSGRINRVEIVDEYWMADVTFFLRNVEGPKILNIYERRLNENFAFNYTERKYFEKYICPGNNTLNKYLYKIGNG